MRKGQYQPLLFGVIVAVSIGISLVIAYYYSLGPNARTNVTTSTSTTSTILSTTTTMPTTTTTTEYTTTTTSTSTTSTTFAPSTSTTTSTTTTTVTTSTSTTTSTTIPFYSVQPVIFLGTDTSIDANSYESQVDASFSAVRTWYSGQLGGKTFNLESAIVYRSPLTETQIYAQYPGVSMWINGLKNATAANGLDVCNDHSFYYFVTPLENGSGGFVGAENLGCDFVLAGTAGISGHMGRLIGGIIDPNWTEWWADEVREAQGGVAHEIGHGLGGSCTTGNYVGGGCDGLPHSIPGNHSIMYEWWEFGTTGIFTDYEKMQILESSFIS